MTIILPHPRNDNERTWKLTEWDALSPEDVKAIIATAKRRTSRVHGRLDQ